MKSRVATAPTFCLAAAALCVAAPSSAETRRVAIVVGNNAGGPTEKPLHYAEEDATKMADVLAQLGDVHAEHLFLLRGRGRGDLKTSIARATELVAGFRANPEDRTVLVYLDPKRLQAKNLSPSDVVRALREGNLMVTPGTAYFGENQILLDSNALVEKVEDLNDFEVSARAGFRVGAAQQSLEKTIEPLRLLLSQFRIGLGNARVVALVARDLRLPGSRDYPAD